MVQGLISMKPRQVVLSSTSAKVSSNGKPPSLTAEQRPLLLQALCAFLESNGFSKTLKKFLSEASLEKDSWKNCLLSLEDACSVYLNARSQKDADENSISSDKETEKIIDEEENVKSKDKKKKKSGKISSEVQSVAPEVALEDTICEEKSSKKAKDKKKKKGSEPAAEPLSEDLPASCGQNGNKESSEPEKSLKSKSERKKKKASKIDDVEENGLVVNAEVVEGTEQDKKSSKKRKKSSSEENKSEDLGAPSEDTKRRKTTGACDEGTDDPGRKTPSSTITKCAKALSEDDDEDNSALMKSSAKKQNGSTEPRTQNAFQRVKADEVEFADEKLQDNSYWAKDGAEIGYGAKAQEVLGQVRGRDFRHEKTKKKRGSYRGGLIDQGTHSVKFNYSDADE